MHTEDDNETRTRTLAVWVDPTMTRHASVAQRAMRVRHALYLMACGTTLAFGSIMGHLFGPAV